MVLLVSKSASHTAVLTAKWRASTIRTGCAAFTVTFTTLGAGCAVIEIVSTKNDGCVVPLRSWIQKPSRSGWFCTPSDDSGIVTCCQVLAARGGRVTTLCDAPLSVA